MRGAFEDLPCFCMTWRNLTMTLELGRIMTWRLPAFSALFMALSASWRTEVRTIVAVLARDSQVGLEMRYLGRKGSYVSLRWHRAWRVPREGFYRSLLKRRSVSGPWGQPVNSDGSITDPCEATSAFQQRDWHF